MRSPRTATTTRCSASSCTWTGSRRFRRTPPMSSFDSGCSRHDPELLSTDKGLLQSDRLGAWLRRVLTLCAWARWRGQGGQPLLPMQTTRIEPAIYQVLFRACLVAGVDSPSRDVSGCDMPVRNMLKDGNTRHVVVDEAGLAVLVGVVMLSILWLSSSYGAGSGGDVTRARQAHPLPRLQVLQAAPPRRRRPPPRRDAASYR
eukprot:1356362-Rhodomonas_salina.1